MNGNRVKSITSKFEVLSERSDVDNLRVKKNRSFQNAASKHDSSSEEALGKYDDIRDKFGPSCNFGNRKRLKQTLSVDNVLRNANKICEISNGDSAHAKENELCTGSGVKPLVRHNSDQTKKLHRTPAFRCDKHEKLKKNDRPDASSRVQNERPRDRLKKLGLEIEERLRQDDITFSSMSASESTEPLNYNKTKVDNTENELKSESLVDDVKPEPPQHILDMYAKVLKSKNKHADSSDKQTVPDFIDNRENAAIDDKLNGNDSAIIENFVSEKCEDSVCFEPVNDPKPAIQLNLEDGFVDDTDVSVDTLKRVLRQPLPPGPPPKKPPRTFASKPSEAVKKLHSKLYGQLESNSKIKKHHRSREESKMMLEKIELAFSRHKSGGKVIVPRTEKGIAETDSADESIGKLATHPSTAALKRSIRNGNDGGDKNDVHYMCTKISDINFSDGVLNSSESSVASSEDLNNSILFANCLSSLNCSSNRRNSGFSYSKFGSGPHSVDSSFANVCCSCGSESAEKRCRSDHTKVSKLSTFSGPAAKCYPCSSNELVDRNFKSYLKCACRDASKASSNSTFFVERDASSESIDSGAYGVLRKSKSQEHIYDEPNIGIVTKEIASPTRYDHRLEITDASIIAERRSCLGFDAFIRNDFRSKTMSRLQNCEAELRPSSRIDVGPRPLATTEPRFASQRRISDGSPTNANKGLLATISKARSLSKIEYDFDETTAVSSTPLLDVCLVDSDTSVRNDNSVNKIEIRNFCDPSKTKRPQSLDLRFNGKIRSFPRNIDDAKTNAEVKKLRLNNLIAEIYDTVASSTVDSPNEIQSIFDPSNAIEQKFHDEYKNYENTLYNTNEASPETHEESLKLTRKLTQKRKEYVRKVSCKISNVAQLKFKFECGMTSLNDNSFSKTSPTSHEKQFSTNNNIQKIKSIFETDPKNNDAINKRKNSDSSYLNDSFHKNNEKRLFNMCALVGWNLDTGKAYIKTVYPDYVIVPPKIETLVFPESCSSESKSQNFKRFNTLYKRDRCETLAEDTQLYSLVLTNEDGKRTYGYCCRIVPEGASFCIPLAYCMVSNFNAPTFYYKILKEIQSCYGSSKSVVNNILNQLYDKEFPKPGIAISIKYNLLDNNNDIKSSKSFQQKRSFNFHNRDNESHKNSNETIKNDLNKVFKIHEDNRAFNSDTSTSENWLRSNKLQFKSAINENLLNQLSHIKDIKKKTDTDKIEKSSIELPVTSVNSNNNDLHHSEDIRVINLERSLEPQIEEDSLSVLFQTLDINVLLKIFGSLLLERKVLLIGDKLSKLSSCIEGLQYILYPFIWQHTVISLIPTELIKSIFEVPIPILAGLFYPVINSEDIKNKVKNKKVDFCTNYFKDFNEVLDLSNFEEGMIIDISSYNNKTPKDQLIRVQGDESTILPPSLHKSLHAALQLGSTISTSHDQLNPHTKKCNMLVAEAFLRFFTSFLGNYKNYIVEKLEHSSSNGDVDNINKNVVFDKESLIKSANSKHLQYFLEWFTETSMFQNFMRHQVDLICSQTMSDIPYPDFYDIFNENILQMEIKYKKNSKSVTKNKTTVNKTLKAWSEKLKEIWN